MEIGLQIVGFVPFQLFTLSLLGHDLLYAIIIIPQLQRRTLLNQDWIVCSKSLWLGLFLQTVMFQHPGNEVQRGPGMKTWGFWSSLVMVC